MVCLKELEKDKHTAGVRAIQNRKRHIAQRKSLD